jgi:hypothetical protein
MNVHTAGQAAQTVETFLYGLTPPDPTIISASAMFVLSIALITG